MKTLLYSYWEMGIYKTDIFSLYNTNILAYVGSSMVQAPLVLGHIELSLAQVFNMNF